MTPAADRPALVHVRLSYVTPDLFTDALHERLERVCLVVDREPITDLTTATGRARLAGAEVLLTGWGAPRLDASVLDGAPNLRLVAHAAGSVRDLVDDGFWDRGIALTTAAAANAIPVAEYAVASILFAGKGVFRLREEYRRVRSWQRWRDVAPGLGNLGRRVGLVGASRVGRLVVERLAPTDLEVVVADPFLADDDAAALGVARIDLDELLATADVVSLHAPLLPATRGMIGRRELALLRDGATLVNTARGGLVDHDALVEELVSGRIDAVLDVTEPEVLPADSPLYELPNVVLTPHIAGSEGAETQRLAALAIEEVERFVRGEPLRHAVTRTDLERIA